MGRLFPDHWFERFGGVIQAGGGGGGGGGGGSQLAK